MCFLDMVTGDTSITLTDFLRYVWEYLRLDIKFLFNGFGHDWGGRMAQWIAFLLRTQWPWVHFLAFPKIYLSRYCWDKSTSALLSILWTVIKLTDVDRIHLSPLDSATKKVTVPPTEHPCCEWAAWGQCSHDCGVGHQHRGRVCSSSPVPCSGPSTDSRPCFSRSCSSSGTRVSRTTRLPVWS